MCLERVRPSSPSLGIGPKAGRPLGQHQAQKYFIGDMDSIDPDCTELKHAYETSFQRWYTEIYLPHTRPHHSSKPPDHATSPFMKQPSEAPASSAGDKAPFADLAASYEEQCGEPFRKYRSCLERILKVKKVGQMLTENASNKG